MAETPQQYQQRMIDNLGGQDAKKVQAASAGRLAKLIRGKSRPVLARKPAPGKWSVNEILAHLAEAEIVIGYRMRSMVGSPGAALMGYDQDAWAAEGNYGKRDAKKSLAQFRALREANLDYLRGLSAEQMQRHGMHSERGRETLEFMVRMIAGHDVNHIKQVEAILMKGKK